MKWTRQKDIGSVPPASFELLKISEDSHTLFLTTTTKEKGKKS